MNHLIVTALIGSVILTCPLVFADCPKALSSCQEVVSLQQLQIQNRDQRLAQSQLILQAQAKEISELTESKDSWLNSKILWFGLGAGAAALLIKH